jgi:hypothetical protein
MAENYSTCMLHGFGDYVNCFLNAHGKGRELRNGAFVVEKALSSCAYLFFMFLYYKRYIRIGVEVA